MENQDISGFVNLEYAVKTTIMRMDEDDRNYEKYMQLAIDGVTKLNMGILPSVKVAHLTLDDMNSCNLPSDYIDYTLIGIEIGGRLWTLTRNTNISLPLGDNCGDWTRDTITTGSNENFLELSPDVSSGYMFNQHYYNGTQFSALYAAGGGFNKAYYRIDERNRRLIMLVQGSLSGYNIVLEYTSSGVNKDTVIPRDAVEYLSSYIVWQSIMYRRDVSTGEKEYARTQCVRARRALYAKRNSFTLSEFLDEKYVNLSQGVKR